MKNAKLFAAASAAALMAGAANAQLAIEQDSPAGATITAPYSIAEEVDFPVAALAGDLDAGLGVAVLTQGVIPPGQNIFLTLNLTNATLTANLDGSEIDLGITGAVVDDGGAIGDSFVRYLITTDNSDLSTGDASRDGININLPIEMSSCGDVTVSVSEFATESGSTPIEGGTAALAVPAITCDEAFVTTLAPDVDTTVLDFTGGFTNFVVSAPDTATTAVLGDYELTIDTAVNVDLQGTNADPAMVLGFESSVDFVDADGVDDGTAAPVVGTLFDAGPTLVSGNSVPLVGTPDATLASETGTFSISIDGVTPIAAQTVSVSGALIDLDDSTFSLQDTDPFNSADVEDLRLNGQYFGPFDWVSDGTKLVNTIFRVTGLDGVSDIPAQVIVANARNGAASEGVFPFTILASDVEGSEVRLNSDALEAIAGQFGTADISLVFSTDLDLDVDRLLAGPSQAVVVPFGDGANLDGVGGQSPTTPPSSDNDDDGNY
jgi:hypothetical protein